MLYILLSVALVIIITFHLAWKLWVSSFKLNMPVLPSIPWIGSTIYLDADHYKNFKFINECYKKFNYKFSMWLGPRPVIFITELKFVEHLLKSQKLITKSFTYAFGDRWLGKSVLTSTGEFWKKRRHMITPAFHFGVLREYAIVFESNAQDLVKKFNGYADKGLAFDVQPEMSLCTLNIINETAMGVKLNPEDDSNIKFSNATTIAKKIFKYRAVSPWIWSNFLFDLSPSGRSFNAAIKVINEFVINVMNENIRKRNENQSQTKVYKSLLDILLDSFEAGDINTVGVLHEVHTFMFAGHDTTSSALSWLFYLLGLNPDIQKKLQEEIDSFKNEKSHIRDRVENMAYLEMVIKETLRCRTSAPNFSRAIENTVKINDQTVVKGTHVFISPHAMHNNPEHWDNPHIFNPERFSKENAKNIKPFTFIPFSAGPRNCIGQKFAMLEMKVILHEIMSAFNVETCEQEVQPAHAIVQYSANGLWLKFHRR